MKQRRTRVQLQAEIGPIAVYIRQCREHLGYTQLAMARRIGVGVRFFQELERGKPSLRMDKVNEVLHYFGKELAPVDRPPPPLDDDDDENSEI